MPQLDKFPILFQFKSFIIIFLFFYFFFLFVVLPLIHTSLRLRKVSIFALLSQGLITELETIRISFIVYLINRNVFNKYVNINEIFFSIINKKIRLNEYK